MGCCIKARTQPTFWPQPARMPHAAETDLGAALPRTSVRGSTYCTTPRVRSSGGYQGTAAAGRMEACFNVPWRYRDAVASPNGEFARDRLGRGNVYCGVEGPLRVEGRQVCRFSAA